MVVSAQAVRSCKLMILLIATFLPILSVGVPPEPITAEPPLEALVNGRWRGMMTADGKTTHMTIEVKATRQGFVGESLMWFGLTEDEARNAQFGALPRQGVHKRAFVIEQDFVVTLAGETIKFAGRNPRRLLLPLPYNPDTFTGRLERPGMVMGTARDTKTVGGFFHLWKEDALQTPLPLELAKGETHELACLDGLPFHYRCHIPQNYDPTRPATSSAESATPLLINFSPMGRGQPLSVKMADEVGWLMVGLKESKNGPMPPNLENLNAVLFDLRRRFNIHPRRVYFSGFSGGSRMASWAAVNHQDACAGVICIGAGHYDGVPPKFVPVFYVVGQSDFNHDEVVALHSEAERSIRKTELIVHPGGHTWGRPQDHEAAIRWLDGLTKKRRAKGD